MMNNKRAILITALIILAIGLITTVTVVVIDSKKDSEKSTATQRETKKTTKATTETTAQTTVETTATPATTAKSSTKSATKATTPKQTVDPSQEFRAVWISYLDLYMKNESGGTASRFTSKVDTMFSNVKNLGFNTVLVQVRPFSDAYYPSGIFPWSYYMSGQQGRAVSYDPLKILVNEAKKYGLELHAWINLYRVAVSSSPFYSSLASTNPAVLHSDWVYDTGGGLYYNPAITGVQKMIIDGVREIVANYGVNGIHIDDYFYPVASDTDTAIDSTQYSAYISGGGTKGLADWRRDNVDALITGIYAAIKSINSNVKFGISPFAGIDKCYTNYYANVRQWVQNPGYCDYVVPQVYFGFENQYMPFKDVANQWSNLVTCGSVKLYFGLAFHKCGMAEDGNAGTGRYEWANSSDMISRQVQYARQLNRYGGIALFRYGLVFQQNPPQMVQNEFNNLKSVV